MLLTKVLSEENMLMKKSHKGFTLIELLVVIAIISILAAILFPVFARARENARRASCMSNLKQIGLGILQYTQDYDEKYPPNWNCQTSTASCPAEELDTDSSKPSGVFNASGSGGGSGHYRTWMDFIFPYVKSIQIFVCPSSVVAKTSPNYGYSVAFGGNSNYYASFGGTGTSYIPLAMAAVTRPAEVICVSEYSSNYSFTALPYNMSSNAAIATNNIVTPHLDGGNQVFADGHVKWWSRGTMVANVGSTLTTCNLASPNETSSYCSRAWNPYRQ